MQNTKDINNNIVQQVGGDHYNIPYQSLEFCVNNDILFIRGLILKYIVRCYKKGGKQDIDKALSLIKVLPKKYENTDLNVFLEKNQAVFDKFQIDAIKYLFSKNHLKLENSLLKLKSNINLKKPIKKAFC